MPGTALVFKISGLTPRPYVPIGQLGMTTEVVRQTLINKMEAGFEIRRDVDGVRRRSWTLVFNNLIPGQSGAVDQTYRQVRKFYEQVGQGLPFNWYDPEENPNGDPSGIIPDGRYIVRFTGDTMAFTRVGPCQITATFTMIQIRI